MRFGSVLHVPLFHCVCVRVHACIAFVAALYLDQNMYSVLKFVSSFIMPRAENTLRAVIVSEEEKKSVGNQVSEGVCPFRNVCRCVCTYR
jgi:hypothetical protein